MGLVIDSINNIICFSVLLILLRNIQRMKLHLVIQESDKVLHWEVEAKESWAEISLLKQGLERVEDLNQRSDIEPKFS